MAHKIISKKYSEAFKRQVVEEYESGVSMNQLKRKYKIGGSMTIHKWIRKYSNLGFRHTKGSSQDSEEKQADTVKKLRMKIELLEKAVADLTLRKLILESTLEEYQEAYGPALPKKNGQRSSRERGRKHRGK